MLVKIPVLLSERSPYLDPAAWYAAFRETLELAGPVFIKWGQWASTRCVFIKWGQGAAARSAVRRS